jgi:DNA-binding beta-propeller fold protein YncE
MAYPRRLLAVLAPVALAGLAGCPASGDAVRPPKDQIFFPTGIALGPDESALFVANANSDLTYDSGTIAAFDLDEVEAITTAWLTSGSAPSGRDCEVDRSVAYTLVCNEREALLADATVRIGNFATKIAVQQLTDPGSWRLFAAVRGDPSITWIDYDLTSRDLDCGDVGASYPECDDNHRLTQLRNDPDLSRIPDEPFSLYVDSQNGYVVATHLTSGAVSLTDAPADGSPPVLSDALGGLFAADPNTGVRGAAGVAGRLPGSAFDRIYVTSRSEARVQTLYVARPDGDLPVIVPADFFFMNRVLPSDDGRGIAFSASGERAFIINRDPPMLQIFDTAPGEGGAPKNELLGAVELCQQASNLAVADMGRGERVYVACFQTGQLWVIDPQGAQLEAVVTVGRGPNDVVASTAHGQIYVSNFLEDTVAVVDAGPGSVTENRVVLRLGRTRQEGGQ